MYTRLNTLDGKVSILAQYIFPYYGYSTLVIHIDEYRSLETVFLEIVIQTKQVYC